MSWLILVVTAVLSVGYVLVEGAAHAWIFWALGLIAVAALAEAVRRGAEPVSAWRWVMLGIGLFVVGEVIYNVLLYYRPGQVTSSLADAAYVGGYIAITLGGRRLAADGAPMDRRLRLDISVALMALALVTWVFAVEPSLPAIHLSLVWVVTLAYPALGILLAVPVARLMLGPGHPTAAARLFSVAALLLVVSNIGYAALGANQVMWVGGWIGVGWLVAYGVLAAAASHPSATAPTRPASGDESKGASRRISLLLVAAMTPMLVSDLIEGLTTREFDHNALAAGSLLLVALMGARVSGVVRRELDLRATHAVQSERIHMMQGVTRLMEQERALTAAEIHDGPVQHQPSMALQLARVDLRLARGDTQGARAIAERVREDMEREVEDLRRLMAGLHPPMLEHVGLEAAVRDLGCDLAARAGCSVSVDAVLEERLTTETEFVLFRVAQEALTNVAKHADARTVRVHLGRKPGWAELDVADDGRGFQPIEVGSADGRHFGLSAMRERVGALGGSLLVESRPGGGTTLTASVPVEGEDR